MHIAKLLSLPLGLATHELHFTIIREEFKPNQKKPCEICGQIGESFSCSLGNCPQNRNRNCQPMASFTTLNPVIQQNNGRTQHGKVKLNTTATVKPFALVYRVLQKLWKLANFSVYSTSQCRIHVAITLVLFRRLVTACNI